MATALTSEYTRFTDKCNKVLAGGIVKTFEPNSLTPKISYQDPNKEIPNLTEVRLDETGRAKIYIDGDYRIQVYSRDGILIEDNLLVEQSLVQRDFTSLSQVLELEQQEKLNQFQAQADQSIQDLLKHGGRAYPTLALANADIANIALDTKVTVLSATDGGDWYKATAGATSLTKSAYDPLTQAKTYVDANALFNPALLSNQNLNDLSVGLHLQNNSPVNAITELNYPLGGQCYVRVLKSQSSSVKHQEIIYTTQNRVFYRYFNGSVWTTTERLTGDYAKTALESLGTVKHKRPGSANLDTMLAGSYLQTETINVTLANNYPIEGLFCFVDVMENTTIVSTKLQIIYYPTVNRLFYRYYNATSWTTTEFKTGIDTTLLAKITPRLEFFPVGTTGSVTYTPSTKTLAWTHLLLAPFDGVGSKRIRVDAGSIVFNGAGYEVAFIDLTNIPEDGNISASAIKVMQYGSGAGQFTNSQNQVPLAKLNTKGEITSCAGFLKIINTEEVTTNPSSKDTFRLIKTATNSAFYLPCSNSNNLIKINFYRQLKPFDGVDGQSQSDIWRLASADKVNSETLSTISNIVQDGEWDTAIQVNGATDHSGGVHGDEMQTTSYFLIDGCHYNQDAVIDKEIKELKFVQKSKLYLQNTQTVLCERTKVMVVTKCGINNYQKLKFKYVADLFTAWITMLPIRRKLGLLNDGAQVTDTFIRFPNYEIENVGDTTFTEVYTETSEGDSFILSSVASGISATVKLSGLKGLPRPVTHVSHAPNYNKLYFSAIDSRLGQIKHTTSVDETWELNTEFTFNAA